MPTRVLLSTEAAVEPTHLPVATKKRRKASLVKPYLPPTPDEEDEQQDDDYDDKDGEGAENPPAKKQKRSRPNIYACTFPDCTAVFNRPCRLTEHLNTHTNTRPHICPDCGKSFFRPTHLRTHIKAVHADARVHPCTHPGCPRSFHTSQHLKRHLDFHARPAPHVCAQYPPCEEGFRKKTQLERHVRTVHLGRNPFQCNHAVEGEGGGMTTCTESFETKGQLEGHRHREHGSGNRYFCEECVAGGGVAEGAEPRIEGMTSGTIVVWPDDEPPRRRRLTRNPAPVHDEDDNINLSDHHDSDYTHTPPTNTPPTPLTTAASITTASTTLGFRTYSALQSHLRHQHPPTCPTCHKPCASNRDLRVHIFENHTHPLSERRKPHTCPHPSCAGKGFARKWGLTVHLRTVHDKEKKFGCEVDGCGKRFGLRATLRKHVEGIHVHPHPNPRGGGSGSGAGTPRPGGGVSLLTRLTGVGYEKGRSIACVAVGCAYRFKRGYDLGVHLQAGHGFSEGQAGEVLGGLGGEEEGGSEEEEEEGDEDEGDEDDDDGEWGLEGGLEGGQ